MTFDFFMVTMFGCALVALVQWLSLLLLTDRERVSVETHSSE